MRAGLAQNGWNIEIRGIRYGAGRGAACSILPWYLGLMTTGKGLPRPMRFRVYQIAAFGLTNLCKRSVAFKLARFHGGRGPMGGNRSTAASNQAGSANPAKATGEYELTDVVFVTTRLCRRIR